jgi:hypothetical protein
MRPTFGSARFEVLIEAESLARGAEQGQKRDRECVILAVTGGRAVPAT